MFIKNKQIFFSRAVPFCILTSSVQESVALHLTQTGFSVSLTTSAFFHFFFFFKLHLRMSLPHTLYFNRLYSAFVLYLKWLMMNSRQETISIYFFLLIHLRISLHRGDGEKPQGTFPVFVAVNAVELRNSTQSFVAGTHFFRVFIISFCECL